MTTKTIASVGLALILTATVVSTAQARRHHSFDRHALQTTGSEARITERAQRKLRHSGLKQMRHKRELRANRKTKVASHRRARATIAKHGIPTIIVANAPGCPKISFCGCAASIEVFGKSIRSLWVAANWFRFPEAEPAPGMVAVRRHHVFVIRQVIAPGVVLAYDANSGKHKTRVHVRRLAGFSVRNPGARSVAASDG